MPSLNATVLFLLVLFQAIVLIHYQVRSDDEEDNLLQGINKYRSSLNLTTLIKSENAACLAEQIAEQYKGQPCTNTTGSNTVPGTENQFPNYPDLLAHCHLNITNTRDGTIMPACVPNLDPDLVLTNFTKSQYSGSLNESSFTGAGIGSDGDWIVVVLTTNTSTGSYQTYEGTGSGVGLVSGPRYFYHSIVFLIACLFLM